MEDEGEKGKKRKSTELQRPNVSVFLLLFKNLVSGISKLCVCEVASPHFRPHSA